MSDFGQQMGDVWSGEEIPMPPGERRLPVYLLLDISSSMEGARFHALQCGLEQFQRELSQDWEVQRAVYVGLITFASDAQLVMSGLVQAASLQVPSLSPSGVTRLDRAFEVLLESMDRDLRHPVRGGTKGDFRPVVFILTDGEPTDENGYRADNWQSARDAVINRPQGKAKPASIIAVGCGPDIKSEDIKAIATGPGIVDRSTLTPEELQKTKQTVGWAFKTDESEASFVSLFRWLSRSLSASLPAGGGPGYEPPPPSTVIPIP